MKKIIMIILGNILLAFAFSSLILEHEIIAGGVSGLSNVVHYYVGFSISICVMIINISLFIVGLLFLGKNFAMKTLISTFLFPCLLEVFDHIDLLHNLVSNSFIACIMGGILIGAGSTLIIQSGGSTGGFDIIALLIEKDFKIPIMFTFAGADVIILLLQFMFHTPKEIVLGITTVFLIGLTMRRLMSYNKVEPHCTLSH